jgi:hypothetical protein
MNAELKDLHFNAFKDHHLLSLQLKHANSCVHNYSISPLTSFRLSYSRPPTSYRFLFVSCYLRTAQYLWSFSTRHLSLTTSGSSTTHHSNLHLSVYFLLLGPVAENVSHDADSWEAVIAPAWMLRLGFTVLHRKVANPLRNIANCLELWRFLWHDLRNDYIRECCWVAGWEVMDWIQVAQDRPCDRLFEHIYESWGHHELVMYIISLHVMSHRTFTSIQRLFKGDAKSV